MGSAEQYFPFVEKVKYEGPDSANVLAFKDYNPEEIVLGRPMKDWLRFSVCYWHTFVNCGIDPFGLPTMNRPWPASARTVEEAKRKADAAFELFHKLGVEYYTFHDRDVSPEGATLEQTNAWLDEMCDYLKAKQEKYNIRLLWGTANLFSHPQYMNGGSTNPQLSIFARAAAQVKKAMEVTHKLGGENFVIWGGREGYMSLLNTDLQQELGSMAAFLRMVAEYKRALGATFQLLIEPKPREPTKHQYDFDAQTVVGFLHMHGLQADFKVNVEPNHTTLAGHEFEHDVAVAAALGFLGSIDCNTGDQVLGWDTDQFLMNDRQAAAIMRIVVQSGGLGSGGLNFDCKPRRESTELQDIFIGHIGAMDTFARGLRIAARVIESKTLPNMLRSRYESWASETGRRVLQGEVSLEDLAAIAEQEDGKVVVESGRQETFEMAFNDEVRQAMRH